MISQYVMSRNTFLGLEDKSIGWSNLFVHTIFANDSQYLDSSRPLIKHLSMIEFLKP